MLEGGVMHKIVDELDELIKELQNLKDCIERREVIMSEPLPSIHKDKPYHFKNLKRLITSTSKSLSAYNKELPDGYHKK